MVELSVLFATKLSKNSVATSTLQLKSNTHTYPILIGQDLLAQQTSFSIDSKQIVIISNQLIAKLYLDTLKNTLCSSYDITQIIIPDGEQYKSLSQFSVIIEKLIKDKIDRKATLIALGGGVVGDLTGFVAACYLRGIHFVQVPTTLLAQVDAAIGGKTAINHELGKNLIGAFHQPQAVIIDVNTLATLPPREFNAGMAEVIKYGLIRDRDFFHWLIEHANAIYHQEKLILTEMITRACANKIAVVEQDELEQGNRALLNLGHTFGHAIEAAQGYQKWLHGEAVAAGMVAAAQLSKNMGWLDSEDLSLIKTTLKQFSLPTQIPTELTASQLINFMRSDKKVHNQVLRLILMKNIGDAFIYEIQNPEALTEVIQQCQV